jgi:hypothetical protein
MPAKNFVSSLCNDFIDKITNKIGNNDENKEKFPNASQFF